LSEIIVWSKPRCVQCTAVKRAFDKAGVHYVERNLPDHPEKLQYFIDVKGFGSAPVVEADGFEPFAGYNPDLVKEIIDNAKFINGPATVA
jgi:glutaredoxin-like protein NrdH